MTDYISREEFIKRLSETTVYENAEKIKHIVEVPGRKSDWLEGIYDAILICEGIPPADVREVVRGRWEKCQSGEDLVCSECRYFWIDSREQHYYHYCPHCGAENGGGEDE